MPKAIDFWKQYEDFEAQCPGTTTVIVWGPMGQRDEMPLMVAGMFVSDTYDAFDAHNCGLDLASEPEALVSRIEFEYVDGYRGNNV